MAPPRSPGPPFSPPARPSPPSPPPPPPAPPPPTPSPSRPTAPTPPPPPPPPPESPHPPPPPWAPSPPPPNCRPCVSETQAPFRSFFAPVSLTSRCSAPGTLEHALRELPLYPPRLRELVAAFDEEDEPAAATWRLVSETAANVGLPRPSYPHIRRLVIAERRRRRARAELRDILKEAANTIAAGRAPGFDYTLGRLLEAHAALVAEEDCVSETQGAFGARDRSPRLAEALRRVAALGEGGAELVAVGLVAHGDRQLDLGLADGRSMPSRWCSTERTFARSSATSCSSLMSSPGPVGERACGRRGSGPPASGRAASPRSAASGRCCRPRGSRRPVRRPRPCRRAAPRPRRRRRPRRRASSARAAARSPG